MDNTYSKNDKSLRNQAFGQRLKKLRQLAQLTQEQLAESVGKSSETISKLERGLIYPGVDMLILLAGELKVSLDSLVGMDLDKGLSAKQSSLISEAFVTLNQMSEAKLKVAVAQLKALQELES